MIRYRLAKVWVKNDTHPYFISAKCVFEDYESPIWYAVSPNYSKEGWARRWARKHGLTLEN